MTDAPGTDTPEDVVPDDGVPEEVVPDDVVSEPGVPVGDGSRVAVVLGASGGIGAAVARDLAAAGWAVVAHRRDGALDAEVADVVVADVRADLCDPSGTRALARGVVDRFGPPALVVCCAGRRDDGLLVAQAPARWASVVADNVAMVHLPARAFLPAMLRARRGAVVAVTSVAGLVASPGQTAYSAAKGAVVALCRSLAAEVGARGVRVNAVAPGMVRTAMTAGIGDDVWAAVEGRQAIGGQVPVADVARVVRMLADTPAITGQVIPVDLGLSA